VGEIRGTLPSLSFLQSHKHPQQVDVDSKTTTLLTATTNRYQCGDGIGQRACSLDRVGPRWGEDLLKGRGGVSTLLSPSYFYIVGIPSHVNIFLIDKEYS